MLRLLTAPIALVYGIAVKVRNLLYDLKIIKSIPIKRATICVGNLTVGGTGKTPHVEYLIHMLSPKYKIAILSRGYKRKTKGFRYVEVESTEEEVGDEPLQIKTKYPEITVAVDGNRVRGANTLITNEPNIEVILLDDAFQHRRIQPGYSILLTDYNNLITNDYFLPLGRLRDSLSELSRADCVIVTKCPKAIKPIELRIITKELNLMPYQSIFFSSLNYGTPLPVFRDNPMLLEISPRLKVLIIAGIANPLPFFDYVKSKFDVVDSIAFPDHYRYTEKKIRAIFERFSKINTNHKIIITTEKDATRIKAINSLDQNERNALFYIPIEVVLANDSESVFTNQIESYVRKSKRNGSLYKGKG